MDFNIRHLGALEVLRAEGSFRKSAAKLGIGQPSLSRQIARMEKSLGVPLVERSVNGVSLTRAGIIVIRHAGRVTEALDDMIAELRELRGETGGELKIAASLNPALTTRFLLGAGWQVHFTRDEDSDVQALVESGKVDLAFMVDDPAAPYQPTPGLRAAVVLETSLVGRELERSPLRRARSSPDGRSAERAVVDAVRRHPAHRHRQSAARRRHKATGEALGDLDTLFPAVETGTGIGLVSPVCGAFFGYRVNVRPLADGPAERKICVWREAGVSTWLVRSLIAEHQSKHVSLAPVTPQYLTWLESNPDALPQF